MTTTSAVGTTGIDYIDSLLYGRKWDGTNLTIAFPDTAASVGYSLNGSYFTALSSTEQTAFKAILARWAAVSGLTFTEVEDPTQADISIYWYRSPDNLTARTVDFPQDTLQAGDIQLGSAISGADLSTAGTYSYFTALHEIGHALGLKHPSETINGFPGTTDISVETSVMSYISYEGGPTSGGYSINSGSYPSGPMMADIAAIQHLYGVNTNALTASIGDTTYTFDPTASVIFQTRWDGGGFDTFNFSSYTTDLSIDLRPGHWSDLGGQYAILDNSDINVKPLGNIAVPYLYNDNPAYLIEAAYGGSGDDLLIGNQANNLLRGTAGNDTMKGMGGSDTLAGGAGNDTFDLTDSTSGSVTIHDFTNDDTIILQVSPGSISLGNGSALTAGQVSLGFTGVYNVLFIGLDGTPGYDFRISLANSTGYDNLSLSGNVISRINDTRAPTFVAASGPVDDATMVSLSATPSLTFHEQVLPATGNFTIYNVTDGTVFKTITPNSGAVTGWYTPTITINPNYDGSTPLLGGKEYAVLWDATAVKDSSNNFAAANSDTTIYNFTTNIRPTATLEVADIGGADAGETSYSFTVTYSDSDGSIDTSSIAPSNVTVTAPDSSALTVTSATWNAATNTATYTVTVPGTNGWNSTYDGTYTIALVDSEVKDDVGDSVTGNSTFGSFTVDLTAPTFLTWQLASDTGRLNNDGITNNGTLNVTRLETGATWEYSLDRGANWTTGSGTSFTLPEGSYADGYIIVRQTDGAGNLGSTGTNLIDLTIDTTAPGIVSIERVDAGTGYTNADSLTFRVTFTEEVYGLAANITMNGTTATLSGSTRNGLTYDFTYTGGDLANLNGAVSISFANSGFADAAGNALVVTPTGANESYIIDNTVPLFVSGEADGDVVTLTFTEVVQRGTTGSFVFYNITDGQVVETIPYDDANITGWGSSSLTLTPSADLPGGKQISVRWTAGAVTDRAGNALAVNSGNTLFNFDSNAQPTLGTVSADDVTQSAVGENSYSFTVSYADSDGTIDGTSIDTGDVTVTGPGGALTVTGAVWNASTGTATYTVAAPGGTWNDADNGSYTIAIVAGQVKDNNGAAVAANNNAGSFTVTVDTTAPVAPTLSLGSDSGQNNSDAVTTFGTINVGGLETGASWEYSLNGGTNWTAGSGTSFTLAAGSYGNGTVQVRQTDTVGLTGAAASLGAIIIDQQAPTLSAGSPGNGAVGITLDVTPILTFTEAVYQGNSGSFTLYNVTDGTLVETIAVDDAAITGWGSSSLTITPGTDLPVGKQIAVRWQAGTVTDLAGNDIALNDGNTAYSFTTIIPPTAGTLTAEDLGQSGEGNSSYSFTVTYADSDGTIDGTSIDTGDVTVTGPGGALTVTGAVWNASTGTATYTVAAPGGTWNDADNGSYAIALLDGQVKDATGLSVAANNNLGSFTVMVDSTPPAAPVIALLADNGVSASDGLTNDGRLGVAGVEDGASWEYSLNGGTSWAAGSGTGFTLAEGIYTNAQIQVRQIDGAGLRGTAAQMGAVTVDNTAPALLSISRAGGTSARTNSDSLTFLVRFDSPINALDAGDFQVTGSTATVTALTDIGSNTYAVTVAGGDLASLNGAVTLRLGAGADVADTAGNAAVTSSGALVESYLLDNSPPVLSNAQVEGSTLTLTSSEALSAFFTTGLEVRVNGVVRAVTASSMAGENITLTLATPVFNGDTVTLSYDADGNGVVDLVGNAAVDTSLTVTNNTDPIPVIEEDGVSITTTMGVDSQGRQTETLSISPSGTRPDDDPFAQIDLVSGDNAPILSASLPPGVGLTVSGTTLPLSASDSAQFLAAQLLSLDGSADISSMFSGAVGDGSITVRTITLTGSGTGDLPISFSGSTDGSAQTLIVLDARNLTGATLVLDNLSYVVVLGNVTVTGGAGSTVAIGDDGVQNMVLGADDDTLHGGGGNDTIGSAAGDDLLFGDAGNDSIFGGIGDDSLSGGSGNDTIDGGDGRDAVLINAAYDTVAISRDDTGTLTVSYGNGETDIIRNAEILRFDDRVMLVDQPDRPMESQRGLTFDEDLYLQLYPDVAAAIASGAVAGAEEHYELYGAAEGRRPNALFNELWYRANNPDVDMAIKAGLFSTAFEHYQTYGWLEGRNPSGLLNMAAINPDRLTFDADYYLAQNPDVAGAVGSGVLNSALEHYMRYGQAEGRDPNALFNEKWYLSTYADAKAAVTSGLYKNGYQHYLAVGWKQGYDPSVWMDTSDYLADNPDVAASGQEPLSHYLNWGIREGRTITAVQDGDWLL